ncbi:MAG: class I SAM-dependent methyltransferase [Mycobacteriales bacterium]
MLDIGCGTGTMLHRSRAAGHTGRLVGVDPDGSALRVARGRSDVKWIQSTAASMTWKQEFDLAMMMNHAFQCLITDEELRASLAAIRRALVDGGRFVFETRNPAVCAWEAWNSGNPVEVVDAAGRSLRITYQVLSVEGDVVTCTETTSDRRGNSLRVDQASLRFLAVDALSDFLAEAEFIVEEQHGGWCAEPLERASAEIVTFARRA